MRVLVTGAEGFVGWHLEAELRRHGHTVIATDKSDTDLALPGRAASTVSSKLDYVVHLAARYGRILCRDEPHRAVTDNAAATTELAAACAERGIPVLYTSSSEVYGDHREALITEDSPLLMPTTIYGLSKRWGEEALNLYLPPEQVCIVRMNMLYGPRQRAGYGCCALATFIANGLAGKPIAVHRDASRSWLYISDAVRALRLLIEERHHGIYNLANTRERMSMVDLAEVVHHATGRMAPLRIIDAPEGQIRHKNYDAQKVERLPWHPEIGLREGVRRTVDWARKETLGVAA